MTHSYPAAPGPPVDRLVHLGAVDAGEITAWLGHDPTRPAVVIHSPPAVTTAAAVVGSVLDELERVAVELFPAWLPEADGIREPGGAGVAAVRALATARAARSRLFAPFLRDLAASALSGARPAAHFPVEVRAAGLARVVAAGFGRERLVVVLPVPPALGAEAEQTLAAAGEWLANCAKLGVWLTGPALAAVDRISPATLPHAAPPIDKSQPGPIGKPHPGSATEAAVEAALALEPWAADRRWNQTYQSHALTSPVRLDLLWPAERCVVELDGPEHCEPARFEADRRRDVQLHLDGYVVLRFTNARVRHDVAAVVHQIGTFVQARQREIMKGTPR